MTTHDRPEPLTLAGPARERGRAHGEAQRRKIGDLFEAWDANIHELAGLGLRAYLDLFWRETNFLPAIERFAPDLLEEVRGIAEGAALSFEEVFCLQNMDEHWHHIARLRGEAAEACSSLGAFGQPGQATCMGQNLDLPKYLDGFQTLLHIKYPDSDLEVLTSSCAGIIGMLGLNNSGLGLCVNTLFQLNTSWVGLPVAYVIRRILECGTMREAVDFACRAPHAAGQNYMIGGPDEIVDLEASANQVARYPAGELPNCVCHTNHPFANDDFKPEFANWDSDRARADAANGLTFSRMQVLQDFVRENRAVTAAGIRQILSARSGYVCRLMEDPFSAYAFSSAVLELGADPVLHMSFGPPAIKPYWEYRFE